MLKKVSLFVVFAFLFLLTACEPVSPANNTIKSNDIKIIKSQEKIEAQTFQLELGDIVSQKTEKNKITDFILRNYTLSPSGTMYSHCKLNKCESKNVFEDNEKNQKLLTSLSGDEYTFRSIGLFAKDETDKLIVDLVDADFEIFSEHTSSLDGDTLTIHDLSKHLPLVVYFPKEHYIQRDFKFYKNTLLFVNQIDPAPFFDKYTVQSKFDNIDFKKINMPIQTKEGFYTQFSAIGQYDSEATVILHGIGKNKPEMTFENPKKGKVGHKWEKGNLVISLSDMQLGEANSFHMSYILDEQKYDYSMTLYPISELKIISSEQVKIKGELSNEYKICFSKYIDEAIFRNKLNQTMGTGVFQLSYHYYPAYGYGGEQYTPGIACYQLFAYVDPQSDHEFNLKDIEDDYGQKISFNINIKQHKLPASQTYLKIVGKPVNVLPKNGERGNKFQVIGKNKEEATLYFRECNWLKDYPEQIVNNLKNKDLNSSTLTHQFLACGETQSHKIIFDEGRYWKERVQEVEINKLFSGHYPDIVEIGVNNFEKQRGKLFIRTNIGILSKYTPNELHVWTHQFRDGKKRPGGMYMVGYYDHSQKKFITREGSISNYFSYNFPKDFDLGFLYVYDDYDASFITTPKSDVSIPSSINNGYDWYYNNFAISPWSVGGNATWEKINPYRLYFFTDRVLYKPGVKSDIFISGWIRKPGNSTIPRGHLSLDLHNSEGTVVASKSIDKFDDFGGFDVSFELAEDAPLGAYYIQGRFEQGGFDDLYYLSYFQVQEFKKPNIDIKTETIFDQKDTLLKISPQYYFGQELQKYDINLIYSLKPQNYGIRDWDRCGKDWCDEPMFYNNVEQHARSSGGMLNIKDYEAKYFNLNLAIPSYSLADFVIDITLSDAQTKEIVHKTIQEKFMPQYLVGIQGRKHHRHNSNNGQYELKGEVLGRISNNKDTLDNYKSNANGSVEIKTYYRSFNNNQSQGPDGEWYYSNGGEYELIDTTSSNLNGGKFKKNLDLETAGKYFIRVIYENNYETHQYVRVYNSSYQYDFYGDMSNNYELNVFANNKEYEVGEEVEINIEPQIKGATAIITVEKEGKMMLQKEQILNGSPIVLNARKERFPNAYISVTQIVGEELNKTVNKRAEPRFYIGYTNIALSPSMMGIDFDISISDTGGNNKDYYSPGETIKLKIKAKDNKGNPLKTRVSVGIIDKSLMDLYDKIRTPLKNFYTRSYPGFFIVSNYQLLYKALNVITADGEKGGGGGGEGGLTPITPRKNFLDIAYWNGAQITDKNGISNFEFVVPDNLTTWVVDVIGVGKRGEMDTKREYLTVSKDIIFNAYLPRFVSPYSVVRIPLSIISNNPDVQNPKIIGNISVGNFENQINIEKNEMGESYFDLDLDKVPLEQIIKHDKIKIFLQAGTYDAVEYDLPIRKESMYLHAFESFDQKSVDEHIKLANKASHVNVKISVSSMPVGQLSEAIRYLLRYPYGCTEQLLSSIYPSLLAKDLSDKGIIEQGIISGDKINYRGEWNDMSNVVASTLNKLYKNQTPSGLMGYWPNTEEGDKWLSIYAYHVITYIKELGYTVDTDVLNKLEKALNNFTDVSEHLYFLMQKSSLGQTVSTQLVEELLAKNSSVENKVYAYNIYANLGQNNENLYNWISADINNYENRTVYHGYVNKTLLKAYFVRGLVKNNKNAEAFKYVAEFMENMDSEGRRGRSTQENMQIIRALSDYIHSNYTEGGGVSAKMSLGGEKVEFVIGNENEVESGVNTNPYFKTFEWSFENIDGLDFSLDAEKELFTSIKIDYIPNSLGGFEDHGNNVKNFGFEKFDSKKFAESAPGTIQAVHAQFEIEEDANQIAVVYSIPVYSYIMNQIGEDGYNYNCRDCRYEPAPKTSSVNEIIFTKEQDAEKRYTCRPDHYEIRYDRLFLYYENLPKGASCSVDFTLMKSHYGVSQILSHSLFEMYGSDVWYNSFTK